MAKIVLQYPQFIFINQGAVCTDESAVPQFFPQTCQPSVVVQNHNVLYSQKGHFNICTNKLCKHGWMFSLEMKVFICILYF